MLPEWPQEMLDRFLCCPVTGQGLTWADGLLLQQLNRAIETGKLLNRIGAEVREPLDAALVDTSRTIVHPCWGGLPTLLSDDAIDLSDNAIERR